MSNYALKSDLVNLPQGGLTNVTEKDIIKLITSSTLSSYEELMDDSVVFFNDSDKPVSIIVQEYDYTQHYPHPLVEKEYTFQPQEEWQLGTKSFYPRQNIDTFPELIVKVDGERIFPPNKFRQDPRWGLKFYINPGLITYYLNSARDFGSKEFILLTAQTLTEKIIGDYGELNFIESHPKGSRVYFQSKAVQGYENKKYINGSTIKVLYEDATGLNGWIDWMLTSEQTVATNEDTSVFYKGLLKGIFDAETGANVTKGFENKSVIVVYEITDPRWGIK